MNTHARLVQKYGPMRIHRAGRLWSVSLESLPTMGIAADPNLRKALAKFKARINKLSEDRLIKLLYG